MADFGTHAGLGDEVQALAVTAIITPWGWRARDTPLRGRGGPAAQADLQPPGAPEGLLRFPGQSESFSLQVPWPEGVCTLPLNSDLSLPFPPGHLKGFTPTRLSGTLALLHQTHPSVPISDLRNPILPPAGTENYEANGSLMHPFLVLQLVLLATTSHPQPPHLVRVPPSSPSTLPPSFSPCSAPQPE